MARRTMRRGPRSTRVKQRFGTHRRNQRMRRAPRMGGMGGAPIHDLQPKLRGGHVITVSGDTDKAEHYMCPRNNQTVTGDCQKLNDSQVAALANGSRFKEHGNGPGMGRVRKSRRSHGY
tara:strand:+ start:673 stop:1029 length:357 start_codon:yes stop_codon:yes gene_type:complete